MKKLLLEYLGKYIGDYDANNKKINILVYHYMHPNILDIILRNKTLRFSDPQFLNDKSEYVHINKMFSRALRSKRITQQVKELFKFAIEQIKNGEQSNIFRSEQCAYYVFCTSCQKDSLPMWNYYIKNKTYDGYNIELGLNEIIKSHDINKIKTGAALLFGDVVYYEDEQMEILVNIIVDLYKSLKRKLKVLEKNKKNSSIIKLQQNKLIAKYNDLLIEIVNAKRLFFKNSCFDIEEEYRFIVIVPIEKTYAFDNKQAFIKHGIFVPYYDMKIKEDVIKSIMLPPNIEEGIAKQGLERYLKCNGYKNVDVKQSSIRVRY